MPSTTLKTPPTLAMNMIMNASRVKSFLVRFISQFLHPVDDAGSHDEEARHGERP
jgi:hypothetical protein